MLRQTVPPPIIVRDPKARCNRLWAFKMPPLKRHRTKGSQEVLNVQVLQWKWRMLLQLLPLHLCMEANAQDAEADLQAAETWRRIMLKKISLLMRKLLNS